MIQHWRLTASSGVGFLLGPGGVTKEILWLFQGSFCEDFLSKEFFCNLAGTFRVCEGEGYQRNPLVI
jgi:hypothetical protein